MINFMKKLRVLPMILLVIFLVTACQNHQSNTQNTTKQNVNNEKQDAKTDLEQEAPKENTPHVNSGLLLGLVKDKEANKQLGPLERMPDEYRTLWIYQNGNELTYIEKQNVVITPYKDKFMKLENNNFTMSERNDSSNVQKGDIFSEYMSHYNFFNIVSHPAGEKVKDLFSKESFEKEYLHGEGYMGESYQAEVDWLSYVGNNYACVMNYHYQTGGGSYRSGHEGIKIYDISNLNNLENRRKSIKLIDLLGKEAQEKLKDLSEKYNKTLTEERIYSEKQLIDSDNLSIKRQNGKWQIQVPLYIKSYHEGNGSSFSNITQFVDTDIKLPSSITSYDTLCIDWDTIRQKVPQAKDAVSSPNKDMLAVLTAKELLIYTNPQNGIQKPSISIPVSENESIILNQWATGEYVEKWSKLINSY